MSEKNTEFDLGAVVSDALQITSKRDRHLEVLRKLLAREYFLKTDRHHALADLSQMVRTAVDAELTMVALWDNASQTWSAITDSGAVLGHDEIAPIGSRSVLERVRSQGTPLFTADGQPLDVASQSIRRHSLRSFLVVPLFSWDVTDATPRRRFRGCLYAHRSDLAELFTKHDVDIATDVARLAQPHLNMLDYLEQLELELARAKTEVQALRRDRAVFTFGAFRTRDTFCNETVIEPLRRVCSAKRVNLMIFGPTGSGKTFLAESFHYHSSRREGPFVVLDCAQVTSVETLSAELFGFAPNSGYTNAPPKGRPGKAELADGGTLFVDEISSLPIALQQKLLRIVERGLFSRLGAANEIEVDLQVIAATNEDLVAAIRDHRFREDLYWRLHDVSVRLPGLADRPLDIPELAETLLKRAAGRAGKDHIKGLTNRAIRALVAHDWTGAGNVRGLERTLYRSVLMAPSDITALDAEHLRLADGISMPGPQQHESPGSPRLTVAVEHLRATPAPTKALNDVIAAIREHGYATKAAQALGISYRALTWQLHKVGLSVRDVLTSGD